MNRRSIVSVVLVVGLLAACGGPGARQTEVAPAGTGTFVSLSDFHFNPFHDPALFAELMATEASGWARVFESSTLTGIPSAGTDSNYSLMASAIRAAQEAAPDPDFVIYSGDFLAHGFEKNFQDAIDKLPAATDLPANDCRASGRPPLQCFIDRTIELISLKLRESFGAAAIYPVLGNNDSYCGDYKIDPSGPFVDRAGAIWSRLLIDAGNRASFESTFGEGGYYVVAPPAAGGRIIVLNTVLYSRNYENACSTGPFDPSSQLRWLGTQLEEARRAGEAVWIVQHVPVGTDVYATEKNGRPDSADGVVGYWKAEYAPGFLDAIAPHGDTLRGIFAGHTHMDHFFLIPRADAGALTFEHVTPAVSPIFGNNPAFEIVTYDRDSLVVLDYTVHNLPAGGVVAGAPPSWQTEYRFSEAYSASEYTAATLATLWSRLADAGPERLLFELHYDADNEAASPFNDGNRRAYWCAIGTVTASEFADCVGGR